ncbi:unnamed protein product [Caretta caretta]
MENLLERHFKIVANTAEKSHFSNKDRSDFVCTKCKLVFILEEKVQGLEKQVLTMRCITETEDFLDRYQDMLLWIQHSEDSEQAAQWGQKDSEEIWQHVTSKRRKSMYQQCRYRHVSPIIVSDA